MTEVSGSRRDWSTVPLWAVASHNDEVLGEDTPPDDIIDYVEISGVAAGQGIVETTEMAFGAAPSRARRRVRSGDILVSTVRTYLRAIAPVPDAVPNLIASTGFAVLRPRSVQSDFLAYAVQEEGFVSEVIARSVGVSYPAINASDLVRIKVPLPSPAEQAAIAAFLDLETAKIDALVEEQRRLIELLKEKRQAIISHVVTEGLDPTVKMIPSGVEWLGDVPAHWNVQKFSRCVRIAEGQVDPEVEPYASMLLIAPNHIEGGTGRLLEMETASEQGAESGKYHCQAGDVVYSKIRPALAKVVIAPRDALCSADMYPMRGYNGLGQDYLLWLLLSPQFTAWSVLEADRVAMPKINRETLADLRVPVPPLDEQTLISDAIARATGGIDQLIAAANEAMLLLRERRSALISAAVTGKIRVNEHALSGEAVLEVPHLVATEAIERLPKKTLGRVKFQKVIYLAEVHADIFEIGGNYLRAAAGPLDSDLIEAIEARLIGARHISIEQADGTGSQVTYKVHGRKGAHRDSLVSALGARITLLDQIIQAVSDLDTKATEAVATLYAVWNDFLLDGKVPTDSEIVAGVLNDWHPEKREKFRADDLRTWLGWMRRHSLTPTGKGPRTTTGRLFP